MSKPPCVGLSRAAVVPSASLRIGQSRAQLLVFGPGSMALRLPGCAHSEGREPDAEPDRPAGQETQGSVASRWLVIAVITSGMSGYGNG